MHRTAVANQLRIGATNPVEAERQELLGESESMLPRKDFDNLRALKKVFPAF